MMGPVQVLVVGLQRPPTFSGDVLAELSRLREAGIIRLVDLLVVSRADDGTLQTVDGPVPGSDFGPLVAELLGQPGPEPHVAAEASDDAPAQGSAWSLDDVVPVGSTAVVALLEHVWAIPLREAIERSGGVLLEESWLAPTDVELLESLLDQRNA